MSEALRAAFGECEMSRRPRGLICFSTDDVRQVKYDQFGISCTKIACWRCREKMYPSNPPPAWNLD